MALAKLLPLQTKDFEGIFEAMDGLPVTVRLLDPPLHEFVPKTKGAIDKLAKIAKISVEALKAKIQSLHEENPMLGHRGCRLGITYPEVYTMQIEAVMSAAVNVAKKGRRVFPEIMIPLVGHIRELEVLKKHAENVIERIPELKELGIQYAVGTMIEVPRATLIADALAEQSEFFSFGTNDLTQMTYGFSRDDVGSFLPQYIAEDIMHDDPFATLDQSGIGQLIGLAISKGRSKNPRLKIGICGEHGGDARTIDFLYQKGVNYVSCSPYRVPVARLAAAQSALSHEKEA